MMIRRQSWKNPAAGSDPFETVSSQTILEHPDMLASADENRKDGVDLVQAAIGKMDAVYRLIVRGDAERLDAGHFPFGNDRFEQFDLPVNSCGPTDAAPHQDHAAHEHRQDDRRRYRSRSLIAGGEKDGAKADAGHQI